jgi:hypothetical protein
MSKINVSTETLREVATRQARARALRSINGMVGAPVREVPLPEAPPMSEDEIQAAFEVDFGDWCERIYDSER